MRRVIAGISNFADVGDTTTLANPEIVDDIRRHVQSEKVARGEVPHELSAQAMEEIEAFGRAE
jgi:acetyl-CoA synthetase